MRSFSGSIHIFIINMIYDYYFPIKHNSHFIFYADKVNKKRKESLLHNPIKNSIFQIEFFLFILYNLIN